jgi:cytochrome c5
MNDSGQPDYTINDIEFLALAESTTRHHAVTNAIAEPWAEEMEAEATARGVGELIFHPAPSEMPRRDAAVTLASGDDPHTLDRLARGCLFIDALQIVARNPATPADALRLLAANEYAIICQGAVALLPVTDEVYGLSAPAARVTLLARPEATQSMVDRAVTDPAPIVRMAAAAHPLTAPADLATLIGDRDIDVARAGAANPNTAPDVLAATADAPRPEVRAALVSNPALPEHMVRSLVEYALNLKETLPPFGSSSDLSDEEIAAQLDQQMATSEILHVALRRPGLDADTAAMILVYRDGEFDIATLECDGDCS